MTVKTHQQMNLIHRTTIMNDEVEGALEDLLSDPPMDDDEKRRAAEVRYALINAAKVILTCVPVGIDRDEAINDLRTARRKCNDAIVAGGGY
jgi:hypothetical protein